MSLFYPLNITTSLAATILRVGAGIAAKPAARAPEKLLELYDFEGCPHCRLVREVFTELDLDALVFPCPKGGSRYRDTVIELGGKAQFPFLVDPNTGTQMYESADIIRYLFATYADRKPTWYWQALELQRLSSVLASMPRMGLGTYVKPSTKPEQPLELYSFESSPFARPVRDLLCELELPYVLRSVGRTQSKSQTRNRVALRARMGEISIPYMVDPNTGTELPESTAIIDYLTKTYAL